MASDAREWDAAAYHRLSNPQHAWGLKVLERLPLAGDETVVDAGCGSGRLTAALAARLPRGRVLAVDLSRDMARQAKAHLAAPGTRLLVVRASLLALPLAGGADAVFSTATFHWILDHDRLFRELHGALVPGGRLVAQYGGGRNLERLHARAAALMQDARFAPHFAGWREPWHFADAETTAVRLRQAGFDDIATDLEPAPTRLPDAETFAAFVGSIILRLHLDALPGQDLRHAFVAELTRAAAADAEPFTLDYVRLNLRARRG